MGRAAAAEQTMTNEKHILVALGGNLGTGEAVLARFAAALSAIGERLPGRRMACSRVYRTAPLGPVQDQPPFLNAVAGLWVPAEFPARDILAALLAIELELGRDRGPGPAQGPRAVDLDLLFVGDEAADEPGPPRVIVPHPRLAERAFVLRPLADVTGPDWPMPHVGRTVAECLGEPAVRGQAIEVCAHLALPRNADIGVHEVR